MDWSERGGAAYPMTDAVGVIEPGMSLRDWLAGKALAGILANPEIAREGYKPSMAAEDAYQTADAMLAARSRK